MNTEELKIIYQHPFATFFFIVAIGWGISAILGAIFSPFDKHGGEKAKAEAESSKAFWKRA